MIRSFRTGYNSMAAVTLDSPRCIVILMRRCTPLGLSDYCQSNLYRSAGLQNVSTRTLGVGIFKLYAKTILPSLLPSRQITHRYCAGVDKEAELHITATTQIAQRRWRNWECAIVPLRVSTMVKPLSKGAHSVPRLAACFHALSQTANEHFAHSFAWLGMYSGFMLRTLPELPRRSIAFQSCEIQMSMVPYVLELIAVLLHRIVPAVNTSGNSQSALAFHLTKENLTTISPVARPSTQ